MARQAASRADRASSSETIGGMRRGGVRLASLANLRGSRSHAFVVAVATPRQLGPPPAGSGGHNRTGPRLGVAVAGFSSRVGYPVCCRRRARERWFPVRLCVRRIASDAATRARSARRAFCRRFPPPDYLARAARGSGVLAYRNRFAIRHRVPASRRILRRLSAPPRLDARFETAINIPGVPGADYDPFTPKAGSPRDCGPFPIRPNRIGWSRAWKRNLSAIVYGQLGVWALSRCRYACPMLDPVLMQSLERPMSLSARAAYQ